MLLLALRLSLLEVCRLGFLAGSLPPRRRRGDCFLVGLRNCLYPLAAGLLEPVPLERAYTSEELVVRLTVLLGQWGLLMEWIKNSRGTPPALGGSSMSHLQPYSMR